MKAKLFWGVFLSISFTCSDFMYAEDKFPGNFSPQFSPLSSNYKIFPGTNLQVQTSIAVHPSNPMIMAASAITDVYPGGYTTGAYVTTNGGVNWSGTNCIRDPLNNIITTVGDPSIVIDKNGTMIITFTAQQPGFSDFKAGVCYSTNNGLYWSPTVYIPAIGKCDKITSFADNSPLSPYYGRVYVVYSDFLKTGLYFSSSTNGGASWDSVKRLSPPLSDARVGSAIGISKYGELYVSWPFYESTSLKSYIGFAKSTNGGLSWTAKDTSIFVSLTRIAFKLFVNECRENGLPTIGVDNSGGPRDGNVYITCTEKTAPSSDDYDVLIHSSTNHGATWNTPHKVNQDLSGSLKYQFFPVLNVDSYGGVNVVYYDSRSTVTNDSFEVYVARSVDGGNSFEDHLLSDHKFKIKSISPTLFGVPGYIGTYIGVTSAKRSITPIWFDNSSEIYQAWTTEIKFGADIKIFPQGLFNLAADKLTIKDTIRAFLRNSVSPFMIIDSSSGILDSVSFISEMVFKNAPSGNYYIEVKHRNSLKVWSSSAVTYSTGKKLFYDFTISRSQTYGGNSVEMNGKWCAYSGDINNDGHIDMDDIGIIFNDVSTFTNGYTPTDVNGDNAVDLIDLNIAFNNSVNFISAVSP